VRTPSGPHEVHWDHASVTQHERFSELTGSTLAQSPATLRVRTWKPSLEHWPQSLHSPMSQLAWHGANSVAFWGQLMPLTTRVRIILPPQQGPKSDQGPTRQCWQAEFCTGLNLVPQSPNRMR
jgi:hypothetical protein